MVGQFGATLDDDSMFTPAKLIVGSFLMLIVILFVYLYLANKALIKAGLHNNRKVGKKSRKGKEVWSYGD